MTTRLDDIILKHMFKIRRVVNQYQKVADTCMIPNPAVKCKKNLEFALWKRLCFGPWRFSFLKVSFNCVFQWKKTIQYWNKWSPTFSAS